MLLIDIYRYLERRADRRPVYLKNNVDQSHHHGRRTTYPSVAIIIPTRDKVELLQACVESVIEKTSYKNYKIVIVDNQSADPQTLRYLHDLTARGVRIIKYPQKFNYSAICNLAASGSNAEYLCFLNNDTEIIEPTWLSAMMDHAVSADTFLVGARILGDDGSLQHAGIGLGVGGVAANLGSDELESKDSTAVCHVVSAVTFACALIRRDLFLVCGGLSENYPVGFNDLEFALRANGQLRQVIQCNLSLISHKEFGTRPRMKTLRGALQGTIDTFRILSKFGETVRSDPYFSRASRN